MVRRFVILALVVAAFLVLAVPAFAFSGYRETYTTSAACAVCHTSGQPANAPKVYNDWAGTKHATDSEGPSSALSLPYGSVCAGCHTANYDPSKVVPTPTATTTSTTSPYPTSVAWAASLPMVGSTPVLVLPQSQGNYPMSEFDIGCSSCHYGADVNGTIANQGNDPADTAHTAPYQQLANADICGACHSRYSYTVGTYTVAPVPYVKLDASGSPIPNPSPTSSIQPQMALGYPMISSSGNPVALTSYLNLPSPNTGWSSGTQTPAPTATVGGYGKLMTYWQLAGVDTPWQNIGHDGSAAQYPEWLNDPAGHANSLQVLLTEFPTKPAFLNSCLQCHSADYRIATQTPGHAVPNINTAKYGITCVGCHTPHQAGDATGAWDSEFDAQLVGNPANSSDLCTTCHNAEIGSGAATPGETLHHTTTEVMNGTGGIVPITQGLLVGQHKGKCVECHMPPTSYSRGSAQLGGNHTFQVIMPGVSVSVSPVPVSTTAGVVKTATMPFSACSTCHAKPGDANATYLQPTIDARQKQMHDLYDKVGLELQDAGKRLGYTSPPAGTVPGGGSSTDPDDVASYDNWVNGELNKLAPNTWTSAQLLWQKAFTNWTYIPAEGSWGIHNNAYDLVVIDTALNQAMAVSTTIPQTVTLKLSPSTISVNTTVTYSGTVSPATAGKVQIQRKASNGVYNTWKTAAQSGGKFSIKVKMTAKGTFYFKAFLPADAPYKGGTSAIMKLVVK